MTIKKKVCMLGAYATGKTSLVEQFVNSIFSEKYLTTVGVKIDKKTLNVDDQRVDLILWDLHGEDEFQRVRESYLRGASGYFLVADGTRTATLETAAVLHRRTEESIGQVPFLLLLNKVDLVEDWEINQGLLDDYLNQGWQVIKTSAKTGAGVEEAFLALTARMLET